MEPDIVELIDEALDNFNLGFRGKMGSYISDDMRRRNVTFFGMPLIQRRVLSVLYYVPPGQWTSAKDVTMSAQVYKSDTSRAMVALETAGYIKTRVDPDDRRSRQAMITEAGIEMVHSGNQQFIDIMRVYFRKFLNQTDMEDFYACLIRANGYWKKLEPEKFFEDG